VLRSRAGSRPAGVAATENRTNSDVIIVRCTNIDPIESCRNACWSRIINWLVAEENGVVIHTPLAPTHTFLPCRPAYPEAWRHYWQTQSIARPVCDSRATCFITLHRSELPLRAVKTEIWRSFCFYANNEIVKNSKFGHGNRLIEFSMTLH